MNLEKLCLWQCHPRLFQCAKNSLNLDLKCKLNPPSPLRDIIYASKEKQGTALDRAIFYKQSNPKQSNPKQSNPKQFSIECQK